MSAQTARTKLFKTNLLENVKAPGTQVLNAPFQSQNHPGQNISLSHMGTWILRISWTEKQDAGSPSS
jgi:hypothetical protein